MRRLGLVALVALGLLGAVGVRPALAANTLCASQPITTLPPAPLTNANLTCDASGNLVVNVQSAPGITPYSGAYNQTLLTQSFLGVGGWDQSNNQFDAWTMAPAYTTISVGQPGIGVIQGIGLNGTVPISGSATILLPINLPTTTPTPQPMPTSAFVGIAGADYSGSVNAVKVNSSGAMSVTGTISTTVTFPYSLPTTTPTPQPAQSSAQIGVMGNGYTGAAADMNALKVNSSGSAFVAFPSAQPVTFPSAQPVTFPSAQPITAATTVPVSAATTLPVSIASTVPVSIASAAPISITNNPCLTGTLTNVAVSYNGGATTQLVAISGTTKIYVCKVLIISAGTANVTLETGTGTTCGTSTTTLTGAIPLAANVGWVEPSGLVPNYVGAAGYALCLLESAAIQVSGSIEYVQQ